jgi:hypothetical protein
MNYKNTCFKSEKTFCLLLSLLTILNGYAFFFAGTFSIGMMITAIYSLASVVKWFIRNEAKRILYSPILMLLFFIILTLISLLYNNKFQYGQSLYDLAKISVWSAMISFGGYFYFNYSIFIRFMIRIAVFATFYLIIQIILVTFLGISLPNALDLGIIRPTYSEYSFSINNLASEIRLSSFWMEPSQYGNYVVAALAALLFDRNTKIRKKNLIIGLFILGIFLSTSSGAIYLMFFLFILYVIKSNVRYRFILMSFITILLCIVVLIFNFSILERFNEIGTFGYSIYRSLTKIELWRDSSRIGASFDVISNFSEYGIHKYIGLGVGNELSFLKSLNREFMYLNSFAKTITWTGYLGVMSYILFFLSVYKRNKRVLLSKVLISICFIGGFYSGLWYSPDSIVFYIMAIYFVRQSSKFSHKIDKTPVYSKIKTY